MATHMHTDQPAELLRIAMLGREQHVLVIVESGPKLVGLMCSTCQRSRCCRSRRRSWKCNAVVLRDARINAAWNSPSSATKPSMSPAAARSRCSATFPRSSASTARSGTPSSSTRRAVEISIASRISNTSRASSGAIGTTAAPRRDDNARSR